MLLWVIYSLCCMFVAVMVTCVCVCLSWFCLLPVWLVVRTGLWRVPPLCEIDIRWSWWLEQYHIQSSFSKGQPTPKKDYTVTPAHPAPSTAVNHLPLYYLYPAFFCKVKQLHLLSSSAKLIVASFLLFKRQEIKFV